MGYYQCSLIGTQAPHAHTSKGWSCLGSSGYAGDETPREARHCSGARQPPMPRQRQPRTERKPVGRMLTCARRGGYPSCWSRHPRRLLRLQPATVQRPEGMSDYGHCSTSAALSRRKSGASCSQRAALRLLRRAHAPPRAHPLQPTGAQRFPRGRKPGERWP